MSTMPLQVREIAREANRHNVSIHPLDPVRLTLPGGEIVRRGRDRVCDQRRTGQPLAQGTLRDLADDTGGRVLGNRSSLEEGFKEIMRDASSYYLLGYTPTHSPSDGKFHPITVRVKRPNVDLRARQGYWAPTAADERRAANPTPDLEKPVLDALAALAPGVQGSSYGRTWIGTARGDGGRTRVTVVWEPLTQRPAAGRDQPARVSLTASDGGGRQLFGGPAGDVAVAAARRFVFDAPPGKVELRLAVEAAAGETLDREIRSIEVPDLTAPDAALSTARVFRGRTARELQTAAQDPAAVPVVAREFARTERLLIRFDAYAPAGDTVQPVAAVLNRNGEKMFDVPVAAAVAGGTHQIDLGLASTPVGEYLLEIVLRIGRTPARQLVAFRVR
jgi:hypothetical protein